MLRNREGQSVDPVPFLVVTGFAFLGSYSFFPVYCLTLGLGATAAVGVSTGVFLALTGAAFHRMVWTARPNLRGEVPAELRLQRVFYLALIVVGVLLLLTLILLFR